MEPLITIAMAIYKPNIDWLKAQLSSLNELQYNNLELLIWDDSTECSVDEKFIKAYITNFPVVLYQEGINLGSTGAFEKLTAKAKGEYIAYCDQDDIWHADKLKVLLNEFELDQSLSMVCSDMSVIDAAGNKVADSITQVRPRQVGYNGPKIVDYMLTHYFVVGCTVLIKAKIAKAAVPFCKSMVHDYWLGIFAATYGKIKYLDKSLISYRIHGGQQTGVFGDVVTKEDYYKNRLLVYDARMQELVARLSGSKSEEAIKEKAAWAAARVEWNRKPQIITLLPMLHFWKCNWRITLFEIALPFMPDFVWQIVCRSLKEKRDVK